MVNLSKDTVTGSQLRAFRTDVMDMTQEDFAKVLGISVSTIRTWEQTDGHVPQYVHNMVKVIAANPAAALSALGTPVGIAGDGDDRWNHVPEHMYSVEAHNRAMAIEKIKDDPVMSRSMDIMDEVVRFSKTLEGMGDKYRNIRGTDLLMLRQMVMLEEIMKQDGKEKGE